MVNTRLMHNIFRAKLELYFIQTSPELVNYVGSDTLCLVRQFRQNGKYIDICFCFVLLPPNFPKLSVNPHSIRLPGGALTTSDTPLGSLLAWSDTIAENDIRCLKQEIKSAGPARIFLYIDYEFSQVMV